MSLATLCDPNNDLQVAKAPFQHNGHSYYSDGIIYLRADLDPTLPELEDEGGRFKHMLNVFFGHEVFNDLDKFQPLPFSIKAPFPREAPIVKESAEGAMQFDMWYLNKLSRVSDDPEFVDKIHFSFDFLLHDIPIVAFHVDGVLGFMAMVPPIPGLSTD